MATEEREGQSKELRQLRRQLVGGIQPLIEGLKTGDLTADDLDSDHLVNLLINNPMGYYAAAIGEKMEEGEKEGETEEQSIILFLGSVEKMIDATDKLMNEIDEVAPATKEEPAETTAE
jgi:hypothetical protein